MTHVRSHKGEPWNEMADSLAEAMNGFCVPGSRTKLERWMTRFWEKKILGGLRCSSSNMCCDAAEV